VELLVAIAITGMISGVLGSAVFQFSQVTQRGQGSFEAIHDAQLVGYWVTLDGRSAQTTNLVDGAPEVQTMTLTWVDTGQTHTVTYSLSGTELERNHNGTVKTVGRNVTSVGFARIGDVVTTNLDYSSGGRWPVSKESTYKICLRPTG